MDILYLNTYVSSVKEYLVRIKKEMERVLTVLGYDSGTIFGLISFN